MIMRIALAVILFAHAIGHFPGWLVPWRAVTIKELPYKTTVLDGAFDLGAFGIRVVGALWLVATLVIVLGASALLVGTPWASSLVLLGTSFSFLLCISDLPAARVGALVNIGLIALLFVTQESVG